MTLQPIPTTPQTIQPNLKTMNIYTNETNGFNFDSVITLTNKLALNKTTLIGAFITSFLLIALIISIPFHVIKCLIISPLMWAWSWFSVILYAVIASGFYLLFMMLYKMAKSSKKLPPIEIKAELITDSKVIESSPVIEVIQNSPIIGLLPAGKITETGKTFQDFVVENLPVVHAETVDINPIKVIEILETVDSNPESKSETFGLPSYEFIKFCTVWKYINTLSNLFKQVKVSELKSYAKDLNIPQYRKLKKLELLIAICKGDSHKAITQ